MIRRLELKNYRGFKEYTVGNLARVNLLVGKNNSGKTSILEAVELLTDGGDVRALDRLARRRGETALPPPDLTRTTSTLLADVSHFFHGHSISPGARFSLKSNDQEELTWEILSPGALPENPSGDPEGYMSTDDLVISVDGTRPWETEDVRRGPSLAYVSEAGALNLRRSIPSYVRFARSKSDEAPPTVVVPQASLAPAILGLMWDGIVKDGKDDEVVEAMRILDDQLTSIVFLSSLGATANDAGGGILVGRQGEAKRQPLGSQGEGMRRLLVLAIALTRAKGGVLLIDEVDTGLHYSILGDVWLLIVETALRLDIQVFLTTHSLDCLRALGWLCGARPDLAAEVSVQKIERGLDEAVALNAGRIQIAVEQDIEVR